MFSLNTNMRVFFQNIKSGPSEIIEKQDIAKSSLNFSGLKTATDTFAPNSKEINPKVAKDIKNAVKQMFEQIPPLTAEQIKTQMNEMLTKNIISSPEKAQELSELIKNTAQKQLLQIDNNQTLNNAEKAIASFSIITNATATRTNLAMKITNYEQSQDMVA